MPVLKSYQPWRGNKDRQICIALAKNKSTLASEWKQFQRMVTWRELVCSAWRKLREFWLLPPASRTEEMEPSPSQRRMVTGIQWHQSHTAMRQTPARYRDKNVIARGMQPGDTLPREGGESPSLEVYKVWLDKTLSNLLSLWRCPCRDWGVGRDKFQTHLNFSLIPGCYTCYFLTKVTVESHFTLFASVSLPPYWKYYFTSMKLTSFIFIAFFSSKSALGGIQVIKKMPVFRKAKTEKLQASSSNILTLL